jgi:hypothetical protein
MNAHGNRGYIQQDTCNGSEEDKRAAVRTTRMIRKELKEEPCSIDKCKRREITARRQENIIYCCPSLAIIDKNKSKGKVATYLGRYLMGGWLAGWLGGSGLLMSHKADSCRRGRHNGEAAKN